MFEDITLAAEAPQRPANEQLIAFEQVPGAPHSRESGSDEARRSSQPKADAPHRNPSALADGAGQGQGVTQGCNSGTDNSSDGQSMIADQRRSAVAGDQGAHFLSVTQSATSPLIAEITQLVRMRRRWHKAEKSLVLQGMAMARALTDGDKDEARRVFGLVDSGKCDDLTAVMAITPFLAAKANLEADRKPIEKQLRKMARSLPVWKSWAEGVKGLGDLRLAIIVGECGDIGDYRNPSCLWKRMGLAVIDGQRQRRVANADAALVHGFNPERAAVSWNLASEIVKAQIRRDKETDEVRAIGGYGQVYLDRKAYEASRDGLTKLHIDNRAKRYMAKRVLRDFWTEWRKA